MENLTLYIAILLALCHGQVSSVVISYDIGHLCTTHPTFTLTGQTTVLTITPASMTFPLDCDITVNLPSIDSWFLFWVEPKGTVIPCDWISVIGWHPVLRADYIHDVCYPHVHIISGVENIRVSVQHNGSTVNMITPEMNATTSGATPVDPTVGLVLSTYDRACFDPTETCHDADTCRGKVITDCEEVLQDCPFLCAICYGKGRCNCDTNDTTARQDYSVCEERISRCVHPDMVCDGYKNCYGGEDEGRLCDEKRESERRAKEKAVSGSGWGGVVSRWWWVGVVVSGGVVWVWW